MKKRNIFILIMIVGMFLCLASCNGDSNTSNNKDIKDLDDGKIRICLLINGNLGDMSFFDSAKAGMDQFTKDYPDVEVKIIEMGTDNSRWEPTLRQTANDSFDLIIVGTTQMAEPLQRLVKMSKYKDRRFIIFDAEIEDNKAAGYPTVHSILFKQNEGGYLAGVLSALVTNDLGKTNTGFIGGMKIDIINDFGYGFMQGVARVNKDKSINIKAYNAYIGDFSNSPKGNSLASTMYTTGNAEILFAAASQAGLGCLDAAKNKNKYIIGVDSDQYDYFKNTDPVKSSQIVTSILKRVDLALYEVCERFVNQELTYGDLEYLGVKEGKIGFVKNSNYELKISLEIRQYIDQIYNDILSDQLIIDSGLKRFTPIEELNRMYDSMNPNK
ncbi:MAG: extracellular solute-binding protein [Bacilli bacterium]|nr:extracellular solute-binding protein [Bacilli bacterium]MDD4076812.1 extracellular solute-binding protein [Bacilli bacterium]